MRYAACADQHYDAQTGTCAQVVFVDMPTLLPELTAADAAPIASLIFTACATAWALKTVARYVRQA